MIEFRPALLTSLKHYSREKFTADLMAGIIGGIVALPLAIASAVLLTHGSSSMPALVTAFCWAAMVLVAALLVLTVMLQKHEGSYKGTVIFPAKTNYALTCAVLVLRIAAIAVSLFAGLAYYVIWGAAVRLFGLAVVFSVKMV